MSSKYGVFLKNVIGVLAHSVVYGLFYAYIYYIELSIPAIVATSTRLKAVFDGFALSIP